MPLYRTLFFVTALLLAIHCANALTSSDIPSFIESRFGLPKNSTYTYSEKPGDLGAPFYPIWTFNNGQLSCTRHPDVSRTRWLITCHDSQGHYRTVVFARINRAL